MQRPTENTVLRTTLCMVSGRKGWGRGGMPAGEAAAAVRGGDGAGRQRGTSRAGWPTKGGSLAAARFLERQRAADLHVGAQRRLACGGSGCSSSWRHTRQPRQGQLVHPCTHLGAPWQRLLKA